jgi:hypothetical protein
MYTDTEDVCQFSTVSDPDAAPQPPSAPASEMPVTEYDALETYFRQGYNCIPFGSAILFRVRQYAPPQLTIQPQGSDITIQQTCIRQVIPLDIYLDSVTTFKGPVEGRFDLDLPYTNPSIVPFTP